MIIDYDIKNTSNKSVSQKPNDINILQGLYIFFIIHPPPFISNNLSGTLWGIIFNTILIIIKKLLFIKFLIYLIFPLISFKKK